MTHNHTPRELLDDAQVRLAKLRAQARLRGEELIEEAKDIGSDMLVQARRGGRKAVGASKQWIVDNPVRAVGIAFVAGAVARGLFGRRNSGA
jgi:ElaB/YqjD/DUF883 family membrane-anchored ribosome-binding protein